MIMIIIIIARGLRGPRPTAGAGGGPPRAAVGLGPPAAPAAGLKWAPHQVGFGPRYFTILLYNTYIYIYIYMYREREREMHVCIS